MCQEKQFNFYSNTKNNGTLPLDSACLKQLSVRSLIDLPYEQTAALN
jgi:hypothetical protein